MKRIAPGIKETISEFNAQAKPEQRVLLGMRRKRAVSREELYAMMMELEEFDDEYLPITGAMCYSPAFPQMRLQYHECKSCGCRHLINSYGGMVGPDQLRKMDPSLSEDLPGPDAGDVLADQEREISEWVDKIRGLGYEATVFHVCGKCFFDHFGMSAASRYVAECGATARSAIESQASLSVLSFRHLDEDGFAMGIVNPEDCEILYEFLRGNNTYLGEQDDLMSLRERMPMIKAMLGMGPWPANEED